jgi:predicted NBD/HSP70 family sugar kinase
MNILVVDIGGTNVKVWRTGEREKCKIPSGDEFTPDAMVKGVQDCVDGWTIDRVSIGIPGRVEHGRPIAEPYNLGDGWVDFDYSRAFGCQVRIMNDAAMQALGSYEGGRMLYLGLGTGIGTTLIVDGKIISMALGHLKFLDETFDDYLSRRGLERYGTKRWRRAVLEAAESLKAAFFADYVTLGGGNAKKLDDLPEGIRRGGNENAYFGGLRMWQAEEQAAAGTTSP